MVNGCLIIDWTYVTAFQERSQLLLDNAPSMQKPQPSSRGEKMRVFNSEITLLN
ncbi:hypothetical protein F7734_10650 [Scytonema sp. UIC 10036]|uniref:hypothetical protein n=1 Tax=Scytonema sp. UIC 10036 TaxID=2304196 RepID=UPI0012DA0509|nr:hypothetical protein [Scytonema sp. UIC 10036]MUG92884.1 hypothetical protein [Scytonema sp. UIC 10036]